MKHHTSKKKLFSLFRLGFLSSFLLDENPIGKYIRERRKSSDADRIYSDWCNVGNDIRNACARYELKNEGV